MRFIKTYERWGVELVTDIREFFSNLKKLTFFFDDYYEIQDFFGEMANKMELRKPMIFFGFTTGGSSFPIVDKVTSKIHLLFDMTQKSDYIGIYNWCNNNKNSGYNYFEKDDRHGLHSSLGNHISDEIAKAVHGDDDFRPYMEFSTFNSMWDKKYETKELRVIAEKMTKESKLNDKYTFRIYSSDNRIEVSIIAKERIKFDSKQLAEIEEAKEFGEEKYKHLKHRIDNKKELDELNNQTNKYNL